MSNHERQNQEGDGGHRDRDEVRPDPRVEGNGSAYPREEMERAEQAGTDRPAGVSPEVAKDEVDRRAIEAEATAARVMAAAMSPIAIGRLYRETLEQRVRAMGLSTETAAAATAVLERLFTTGVEGAAIEEAVQEFQRKIDEERLRFLAPTGVGPGRSKQSVEVTALVVVATYMVRDHQFYCDPRGEAYAYLPGLLGGPDRLAYLEEATFRRWLKSVHFARCLAPVAERSLDYAIEVLGGFAAQGAWIEPTEEPRRDVVFRAVESFVRSYCRSEARAVHGNEKWDDGSAPTYEAVTAHAQAERIIGGVSKKGRPKYLRWPGGANG